MDQATNIVLSLAQNMGFFGYWVAFFAGLFETVLLVGLLLPGSTFLVLMGVLAGQGYLDLGDLLVFAVAGATLGDNVNYSLGRKYGQRWLLQSRWFLKTGHIQKAREFFGRHGGKSVFLGRFIPSVKELIPFVAGIAQMRRGPFMLWNLLGAIGWGLQWIVPGYLFSQSLALAHVWLSRIGFMILLAITLLVAMYGLRWLAIRYGASGLRVVVSILGSMAAAIRHNPDVVQWTERHPRLVSFLAQRVDTTKPRGLPVTLAALAMGYVVILFGGLIEDFMTKEAVVAADARLNGLIESFRTPLTSRVFYGITSLGNWPLILCGVVGAVLVLWRLHRTRFIVPMLVSTISAQSLTFLGKLAFHRPRPADALIAQPGYSFPSGHASVSVAFYGFLCFVLIQSIPRWSTRVNVIFGCVLTVLLIGFSRIYLGAHYPSDVLAGYLVGGLGLLLGIALTYSGSGNLQRSFMAAPGRRIMASWFAVVAVVGWILILLYSNLNPPPGLLVESAQRTTTVIPSVRAVVDPADRAYARSVVGRRKAPINVIFLAPDQARLSACLEAAGWQPATPIGWGSVIAAYFDLLVHRGNPNAPLSPWFWGKDPQTMGWVQSDSVTAVFDREYLRIWQTRFRTGSGHMIFVATTGHESLPAWSLIPRPESAFDAPRARLLKQLRSVSAVKDVRNFTRLALGDDGQSALLYEGRISDITLDRCRG